MPKRFTLEFLNQICSEKGMALLKNYSEDELNSQKFIDFKCIKCNENTSKRFEFIIKYDALCKNCSCYVSKNRIKYNMNYLQNICNEKSIALLKDYSNEPLDSLTFIDFKCIKCNENTSKRFEFIIKYDAICHICSYNQKGTKARNTTLIKYGVKNISQLDYIKNKKKETTFKNYGVEHNSQSAEIREKCKLTCFKNHGVEYPMQSEEIRNKGKITCLTNYGVEHPHQNSSIAEKASKNCYKSKLFIFPSGNEIKCQGYEPFALHELIKNNINENDIKTGAKNVPTIWYNDIDGKKHRHYVDIFIPSQNKCIEVKSTWTAEKTTGCIFLKQNAAKKLGYDYEIWIYDKKGNRVITHV
jgi:hypothetical protein